MTISSTTRKAGPFTGNGTANTFPFAFNVFATTDVYVVKTTTATGVASVLVLGMDYTVSLNADQNASPGGNVVLTAGNLATGYTLALTSAVPELQPTDFTNQGGFYPSVLNQSLDRLTVLNQQTQEQVDRSIKVPLGESAIAVLPSAADRANKTLTFDDDGNPQTTATPADVQAAVNLALAYRDQSHNYANSSLGYASDAQVAKGSAQTAQTAAEAARDAALSTGKIYTNTTNGLANTSGTGTTNRYFMTPSSVGYESLILYRNDTGTAVDTGIRIASALFTSTTAADAMVAVQDHNGKDLWVIDKGGRPVVPGVGAFLDSVVSNDLVKAWEYEAFADTAKSSYFRDKAKSALAARFSYKKLACLASEDANTSFARFPFAVPVSDSAGILLFAQRHSSVNNGETRQRLVVRDYTINHITGGMTVSATRVIDQPSTWAAGTGGYASGPAAVRVPSGAHAGRIVTLYNRLETDGLLTDPTYERAIHCLYSDDNGATWSATAKVMGAAQLYNVNAGGTGGVPGAVPGQNGCVTGAGGCMVRIPSGTYAGRIVCSLYDINGSYIGAMYSNDDGVTWTRGTLFAAVIAGKTYNESAITYCSDGTLAMLMRCENTTGSTLTSPGAGLCRSTDGGATWSFVGHVSSAGFGNTAIALLTASLAGADGFPKLVAAASCSTTAFQRDRYQIRLSYDQGSTFVAKADMFPTQEGVGYGNLVRLPNGRYLLAYETFNGVGSINVEDSILLYVFNEAEIFSRSTLL